MEQDLHRAHAEHDQNHWWFQGRRRIIDATLERHVPRSSGGVLDVGCGAGGLFPLLRRFGQVDALEPDAGTARVAAERHPDVFVRVGKVPEDLDCEPTRAVVTAFDVIEHIGNDVDCLKHMAACARPGGNVVLTVPAIPWLWSPHDVQNHHFRRYTARSLERSLRAAGLEIVHLSYFNALLFAPTAAVRVLSRYRTPTTDFDRQIGPLSPALAAVFGLERLVVSRWRVPIGVSLIAVARKP